ncbi:phosphate ABC transporter substrate-binding protein, PhoT family [Halogranum amylolyticum]|uniref:Phosphate ABC transporter substrate-binding protein, PhoT family n=1 Tax=Halogranum amylolyticum TaxID=660520 RepID=A0A1H8NE45_9EURY|nr:PstS family phosphate ABC transporter substrate-binding protein [Halogranum amylolyticum]SEO27857.1 phosphate ABC transporter substrate-binding protein, PhoT family [Halogranum amylolyticum]
MTRQTSDAKDGVSRRKFLAGAGTAGVMGIAGCTSNPGASSGDGGSGNGSSGNGSAGGSSGNLSGQVVVKGSSTVYPVSSAIAEEFMKEHEVNVSVDSTGTGGGFQNHFCPGNADINGASRPIQDSEKQLCSDNDVKPIEFQVASDALTVAVNNEADWVDCLSFDQLAQIWKPDGAQMWSDINSEWPDKEFELYGPASSSGTFDWFIENVIGEDGSLRSDYEPTENDNRIIQGIEGSQYAMGFFGFAYYQENSDSVKAVKIKENADGNCVEPTIENAKSGDYPMTRPLFVYAAQSSLEEKQQVYAFMEYYLNQAETDIVSSIGYVPSSTKLRDENLNKLKQYSGN